jgi:hypothetical protein
MNIIEQTVVFGVCAVFGSWRLAVGSLRFGFWLASL